MTMGRNARHRMVAVAPAVLIAVAIISIVKWRDVERVRFVSSMFSGTDQVELDVFPGGSHAGPEFSTPENCCRTFDFLDRWVKA